MAAVPALPNELTEQILTAAAAHLPSAAAICRVCRLARTWMLPFLYNSVTLQDATQMHRFLVALEDACPDRLFPIVEHLWLGPIDEETTDLHYGSSAWPLTIIHRILYSCVNLRSLAIINLYQTDWFRFEGVIPRSMETLILGPIHGPVKLSDLSKRPKIREFVSAHTYMRDDEVKEIATSSSIRVFRRVVPATAAALVLDQLECVSKAKSLELFDVALSGAPRDIEVAAPALEEQLKNITTDGRVRMTRHGPDWRQNLYREWSLQREP